MISFSPAKNGVASPGGPAATAAAHFGGGTRRTTAAHFGDVRGGARRRRHTAARGRAPAKPARTYLADPPG